MITADPYGLAHCIRPGHLPEPVTPMCHYDPPEVEAACLSCSVRGECNPRSKQCRVRTKRGARGMLKEPEQQISMQDERIRDMPHWGWRDLTLCRETGITPEELERAKKRIRDWERRNHKRNTSWWRKVKAIIRAYPGQTGKDLSCEEMMNYKAVKAAIEATQSMENGEARMKVIRLVHLKRTHTLEGAALAAQCSRATAARWQRRFFEEVARNMGLHE